MARDGRTGGSKTAARIIGLSASPMFLAMAILAHATNAPAHHAASGSMALMYLLMGIAHLPAWLSKPTHSRNTANEEAAS